MGPRDGKSLSLRAMVQEARKLNRRALTTTGFLRKQAISDARWWLDNARQYRDRTNKEDAQ